MTKLITFRDLGNFRLGSFAIRSLYYHKQHLLKLIWKEKIISGSFSLIFLELNFYIFTDKHWAYAFSPIKIGVYTQL